MIPGRKYGLLKYGFTTYDHWPFLWYPDTPLPTTPVPLPEEIWIPDTKPEFALGNKIFEIPNG
jgi:hypothetical protein